MSKIDNKKPMNRSQRKALERIKKLAELQVLQLEKDKYGVSARGADGAHLGIIVDCAAQYLNSMIQYSNAHPDATFGDWSRFINGQTSSF